MSEIKNPEQQMDKPSVENSPEKLREAEASRTKLEDRLDSNRNIESTARTENPEKKYSNSDRAEPLAETKEKLRENNLDNMSSEGKINENSAVPQNPEKNSVEKYEGYKDFLVKQREIGRDESLSKEQKVDAIQKEFQKVENKTDINVPSDAKYVDSFTKAGDVKYDWPKNMGFETEKDSIKSISRDNPLPEQWDRYGHMGGSNFSSVPESGKYSYSERAIPYVENEAAYHKGTFNNETYFDKIDAIKNGDLDGLNSILKKEGIEKIDQKYFDSLQDKYQDFIEDTKESLGDDYDATYGLSGTAAPWGDMSGGAEQYVTPFNGNQMETLGMLKENNHE